MKAVIRLVVLSSLIAACGGGSSSPGDDDDTPPADSNNNPGDGPSGACTVAETYDASAVTAQPGAYTCPTAGCAITDADQIFVDGTINADPDLLSIELYEGFGAFTKGITTGTFEITGDEANYETCGACVVMYTDISGDMQFYMATGGTLTITTLSPNVTGTITGATFTHATVDDKTQQSTPVGDCDSAATGTYSFSVTATEDGGQ